MWQVEEGLQCLKKQGARITNQRIAVLKSLHRRTDHPSADLLYRELKEEYPTLSIATIYNIIQLLSRSNLIRVLSIDDKRVYIDPDTSDHGHFLCKKCGKLLDMSVDTHSLLEGASVTSSFGTTRASFDGDDPDSHRLEQIEFFCYGTCSDCKSA